MDIWSAHQRAVRAPLVLSVSSAREDARARTSEKIKKISQ